MGTRRTVFPRAAWACVRQRRRRRRRRRARGHQRDRLLHAAVAAPPAGGARAPRPPRHVRRPSSGRRGRGRRASCWRRCRCASSTATPLPDDLRGRRGATCVALGVPEERVHVAYLGVEEPRSSTRRAARGRADAALPRAAEAVQAHRGACSTASRRSPSARLEIAGDGDHRAGAGGRDRAPRARRPRDAARPRRRGGEGAALLPRLGRPDRVVGRGLVPDGDGGGGVRHAERGAARRRAARVDRRRARPACWPTRPPSWPSSVRDARGRPGRARRGSARRPQARAREFTWDRTARREPRRARARGRGRARRRCARSLRGSETAKAVGLAAATMASNVDRAAVHGRLRAHARRRRVRLAGRARLHVPDPVRPRARRCRSASARETALGRSATAGGSPRPTRRWMRELARALVVSACARVVLREQLASLLSASTRRGRRRPSWRPAAVAGALDRARACSRACTPTARSAERHRSRPPGGSSSGCVLVAAGLGVTGAYLASPLSMLVTAVVLAVVLRRRLGPAPTHDAPHPALRRGSSAGAWAPVLGLTLVAVLQNIDVIIVKRHVGGDGAGAYAAAAVAAKAVDLGGDRRRPLPRAGGRARRRRGRRTRGPC